MENDTFIGEEVLSHSLNGNAKNVGVFCKYLDTILDDYEDEDKLRCSYQTAFDLLQAKKEGKKLSSVLEYVKEGKVGWNHSCFDKKRYIQKEQDEFIVNPFHVEEGVNECPNIKCKSKRVISYSSQIYGGDESTTVFCTCAKCGRQWKTAK